MNENGDHHHAPEGQSGSAAARNVPDRMKTTGLLIGLTVLVVLSGLASVAGAVPATAVHPSRGMVLPGWPMFRGNVSLTGVASGTPPERAAIAWSSVFPNSNPQGNNPPYQSSPVVSQGLVYVTMDNVLYAVNSTTGITTAATYLPGGPGSGPAVGTPSLLSGNILAVAQDGGPNSVWFQNMPAGSGVQCPVGGNPISGSAVPASGAVFLSDTAGNIWRVTLGTLLGCPNTPWQASAGGAAYFSTPAVGYVGGAPALFLPDQGTRALDGFQGTSAATATPLAGFPTPLLGCRLSGSLALLNMTNGTSSMPVGLLGDDCRGGGPSHILAVDLATGHLLANLTIPLPIGGGSSGFYASPALGAAGPDPRVQPVYFASEDGNLSCAYFATGPTGGQMTWGWNFTGKAPFYASPVAWGGLVLDGDTSGWFYALNASTGALVWEVDLGSALYASPAVVAPDVYEVTAQGMLVAIGPAAPPLTIVAPATEGAGGIAQIAVHLGALNASGQPAGGLSGATVTLNASAGFLASSTAVTNSSGVAVFSWTAPAGSNSPISVLFQARTQPAGYGTATAQAVTLVPPGSGTGNNPLSVALGVTQSVLAPGQSSSVSVTVSQLGLPLSGASVSLVPSPALGSVTPSTLTTGVSGSVQFSYTAPAQVPTTTAVTLEAMATQGTDTGSAAASIALVPAGTASGLSLQWQNTNPQVSSLGSIGLSLTVVSAGSGAPVANASVALSILGSGGGSLTPVSVATNAQGVATTTFQAPSVGVTTPVLVEARGTLGNASASSVLEVLVIPRALTLSWVLPAKGIVSGGPSQIGVVVSSGGSPVGAGIPVTFALTPVTSGTANTSTATTDGGGTAWFTVTPTKGVTALTLSASAGGGNGPYGAANTSLSVPVGNGAGTSGASSASAPPWYLWLAIALAAVGLIALALALLGGGRRRRTRSEPSAPETKVSSEKRWDGGKAEPPEKEATTSASDGKATVTSSAPASTAASEEPTEPAKPAPSKEGASGAHSPPGPDWAEE